VIKEFLLNYSVKKKPLRFYTLITVFVIFTCGLFNSCSVERKIAEEFISKKQALSVFLIKPAKLINTNNKTEIVDTLKDIDQYTKDSLLINSSIFLKDIIDTLFLNEYYNTLKNALAQYSITVYTDSESGRFFSDTNNAYIFNLAQNEVEEALILYSPSVEVDSTLYYREFYLNQINFNNWIEVTALIGNDKKMKVLYSSQSVSDEIAGRFRRDYFTGEIEYYYSESRIDIKDVYNVAYYSAAVNASYIYDYIMNCYIAKKLNKPNNDALYFHYDPDNKRLVKAGTNKFSILK
jgi:hypothetical protein